MIDYILACSRRLKLKSILGFNDLNWFVNNYQAGAPNGKMPSDHLPIAADYLLV